MKSLSVLIATRDRACSLERTLLSIAASPPSASWEVIVIDNGSRDDTARLLDSMRSRLPLVVASEPRRGKNRALNRGLDLALGQLLTFTDDDVIASPGWLEALLVASRRWPRASIFGGPILPRFPPGTPAWIRDPGFPLAAEAFGRKPEEPEGYTESLPYGANLALRASVFERIRFDGKLGPGSRRSYAQGSEYELLLRLRAAGERIVHVPDARVEHRITPEQTTVDWLLGRAERVGRGSARLKGKRVPRGVSSWLSLHLRRLRAEWVASSSRRGPDAERFAAAHRAHYWRGYLDESRRIRRERRSGPDAGGPGPAPIPFRSRAHPR
ncbi:MAG: glycosyltransferase family 2 protein [bacterium]